MPIDRRFYDYKGPQSLRTLSSICGFDWSDQPDIEITGVAGIDRAGPGDICFLSARPTADDPVRTRAAACFLPRGIEADLGPGVVPIVVRNPRYAHTLAAHSLFGLKDWDAPGAEPAIHPTAHIAPSASISRGVAIGENTRIGPHVSIGPGVQIGADCVIAANVSVRCALIGNGVTLLSGARIGESGFGVTLGPDGAEDVPQWGRVILQDYVTIGANTCVDRGAFEDTIIGERTRIDNLCQIAHNVVIGRNVMIASFTGISGSTRIGDGVVMGGRVGIADHVTIGDRVTLAASSGIFRDVPEGEKWGGTPGRPLRQYLREIAWLQKQIAPGKKNT